jgi:hypothetical protein
MAKTNPKDEQSNNDSHAEIERLKKEIEGLQNKSQVASLEAQIEELKKQDINAQNSNQQAMTNLPGYSEEFQRLKADAVKQLQKDKITKIQSSITATIMIPIAGVVVYYLVVATKFTAFLEMDANFTQFFYLFLAGVFALMEISAVVELFRSIFINPNNIPEATLSYLSLTAKEHVLDPKGSVIREKYGTSKWTAVTQT